MEKEHTDTGEEDGVRILRVRKMVQARKLLLCERNLQRVQILSGRRQLFNDGLRDQEGWFTERENCGARVDS